MYLRCHEIEWKKLRKASQQRKSMLFCCFPKIYIGHLFGSFDVNMQSSTTISSWAWIRCLCTYLYEYNTCLYIVRFSVTARLHRVFAHKIRNIDKMEFNDGHKREEEDDKKNRKTNHWNSVGCFCCCCWQRGHTESSSVIILHTHTHKHTVASIGERLLFP